MESAGLTALPGTVINLADTAFVVTARQPLGEELLLPLGPEGRCSCNQSTASGANRLLINDLEPNHLRAIMSRDNRVRDAWRDIVASYGLCMSLEPCVYYSALASAISPRASQARFSGGVAACSMGGSPQTAIQTTSTHNPNTSDLAVPQLSLGTQASCPFPTVSACVHTAPTADPDGIAASGTHSATLPTASSIPAASAAPPLAASADPR